MQRLYGLGARRVLVTGTGPLGCVPAELACYSRNGECAEELQLAASLFNPQLVQMIDQLNTQIGHTAFIAANTNQMNMDFVSNPRAFGIYICQLHISIFCYTKKSAFVNLNLLFE